MRLMSFATGIDAMAQPSNPVDRSKLLKRIFSSLVLLAIGSFSIWLGGWPIILFLGSLTALMVWEWCRLVGLSNGPPTITFSVLAGCTPLILAKFGATISIGAVIVIVLVSMLFTIRRFGQFGWVIGLGPPLIVGAMMAAMDLRIQSVLGLETLIWVVIIVAGTDIGAYAVGKTIGGPRMAPKISPGKTWSGLAGGVALATIVSVSIGSAFGGGPVSVLALLGAFLAVVSQGGDLLESAWKRYFDVKDSSGLLPGHGGFLDRFDGYLTVLPIVALMAESLGRSPIIWQ
jgi:phosphatidate cytidylyltransferase